MDYDVTRRKRQRQWLLSLILGILVAVVCPLLPNDWRWPCRAWGAALSLWIGAK